MLAATLGAVCMLGACASERRAADRVERPRTIAFSPTSGSIEGGRLVFVDIHDGPHVRGRSSVACRFGKHTPIPATFDQSSGRYTCPAPAHERPEAVTLAIEVGGATVMMAAPFVYVTRGMGEAPPVVIDVAAAP